MVAVDSFSSCSLDWRSCLCSILSLCLLLPILSLSRHTVWSGMGIGPVAALVLTMSPTSLHVPQRSSGAWPASARGCGRPRQSCWTWQRQSSPLMLTDRLVKLIEGRGVSNPVESQHLDGHRRSRCCSDNPCTKTPWINSAVDECVHNVRRVRTIRPQESWRCAQPVLPMWHHLSEPLPTSRCAPPPDRPSVHPKSIRYVRHDAGHCRVAHHILVVFREAPEVALGRARIIHNHVRQ